MDTDDHNPGMGILHAHRYLPDQSLAASFAGPTIDTRTLMNKRLSFTASWTGVASTDGDFYLEVTDDPRAALDKIQFTSTAAWVKRTIPDGATDGTNISVADQWITIDANAGSFNLCVTDMPAFVRLGYTRRGGGGAAQLQVFVSGG